MPLLVVPVDPDHADAVTLAEWDELCTSVRVVFERADHPLAARLRERGVEVTDSAAPPAPDQDDWAFVTDERSPQVIELARAGARVSGGVGSDVDPLTAAHGAYLTRRGATALTRLALTMARLRGPDGCPWDREQTHESLRVHLIEEAHEVLEAIDLGRTQGELEEELGDLLLQVAFHAQLAADDDRFDLAGVADAIVAKLVSRHPHVFGDTEVAGSAEVVSNWEAIKAREKKRDDPFEGIPSSLSALLAAYKVQKRAAPMGFAPQEGDARAEALRALGGEGDETELGDALFWLVALSRARGVDPEGALRSATARFRASLTSPND